MNSQPQNAFSRILESVEPIIEGGSIFSMTAIGVIEGSHGFHPTVLEYGKLKTSDKHMLFRWFWVNPKTKQTEPCSPGFESRADAYDYAHQIGMPLIHPKEFNELTQSIRSTYTGSPV